MRRGKEETTEEGKEKRSEEGEEGGSEEGEEGGRKEGEEGRSEEGEEGGRKERRGEELTSAEVYHLLSTHIHRQKQIPQLRACEIHWLSHVNRGTFEG